MLSLARPSTRPTAHRIVSSFLNGVVSSQTSNGIKHLFSKFTTQDPRALLVRRIVIYTSCHFGGQCIANTIIRKYIPLKVEHSSQMTSTLHLVADIVANAPLDYIFIDIISEELKNNVDYKKRVKAAQEASCNGNLLEWYCTPEQQSLLDNICSLSKWKERIGIIYEGVLSGTSIEYFAPKVVGSFFEN